MQCSTCFGIIIRQKRFCVCRSYVLQHVGRLPDMAASKLNDTTFEMKEQWQWLHFKLHMKQEDHLCPYALKH